ncbi:TonB-dependent receptor [Sphingomonas oligophenolica]|uniref:TonB-dependent receptor n=1 Tax=Sphingomonas oligophenolica TaxID=301154 RepID=A0A502CLH2_9SPHN|nr:TonB-dependent receptor [Sphingomonas oligophenolica]TPG13592.1 TonB-dependent receptor [Sphingomonas oligophenolica]
MIAYSTNARRKLRAGTALKALALVGASVGAIGIGAPVAAQDFQNVIASGRVQGTNGTPVAGATVEIRSDAQGFTRATTTDRSGAFRIGQVPAGQYTITISADGYDTYTEVGVALTQSGAANQFTLAPSGTASASTGGDIVVTAGRIKVADFDQTTTGSTINVADLADRVPVARDLTSIIKLSPGSISGDGAFGNLSSVAGSSVAENVFFVNGLNVTNFRTFLGSNAVPFEFYDTVDIKNGGYQAEFGRATGAVVTATTKSGSNTFHAGAVVTFAPKELADKSPNTLTQDNDNDLRQDLRADFYVSGPVIKDHLFFYGLYESRYVQNGDGINIGKPPTYISSTNKSPFFAGKVDAVITDGQRLEFTYFRTTSTSYNTINAYDPATNRLGDYQSSYLRQFGGNNYVGRYTGSFTDWLTVSAAYGRSNDRDNTLSSTPNISRVRDYRNSSLGPNLANQLQVQSTNEDERKFYRGDVDLYVKLLGTHHFRFGYDHEDLTTTGTTNYTGGSFYAIRNSTSLGTYYTRRVYETGGSFHVTNEAFYAQDSWTLLDNRLTLQLGIRNDRFVNNNANDEVFYKSGDQWGPRLGFTIDPLGTGRSKIYGSFGRYFLPIGANTNIRLAGRNYDVTDYFKFVGLDANNVPLQGAPINIFSPCLRTSNSNCRIATNGEVASTLNSVATNLKPQSVDEYILGGEVRAGSYWRFGVYGTYRKLNRALEDSAIDQAAINYCNANKLGCAALYTGFSQYVLNNPGEPLSVTLLDGKTKTTFTPQQLGYPRAERFYKAMTFKVDRDFDGTWSLSGSYTYAKGYGNYEGGVKSDIGQTDVGLTQDFDQPGFTNGAYGYLPNDRRHNFKLYGSYRLFDWLTLGASGTLVSPRRFGCLGVIPPEIDPYASLYGVAGNYCRYAGGKLSNSNPIALVRRGTALKSDWQSNLDVSAAIRIPSDTIDAVIRFDVFNVLNSKSVSTVQEAGGQDVLGSPVDYPIDPNYGAPTTYQPPRYVRAQLQFRF